MNALNRSLLAVVIGTGIAIVLAEAILALLVLVSGFEPLLPTLAAGEALRGAALVLLGLVWLWAAAAGGAVTAGLSQHPLLAVPVGLACGIPVGFTALVGLLPAAWALALALSPVLGCLLGARAVVQLQRRDRAEAVNAWSGQAEL